MQREAGGNALIGRQVYPLLVEAGFEAVRVSPRMVYVDASRPAFVDGFTRKTFTAMIEGIREPRLRRVLSSRRASMQASALSTARPRRTACSAIRSSRAWARRDEAPDRHSAGGGEMYGLIGKLKAIPGQRDALTEILLDGAAGMPGCLSYVVATDPTDGDAIWITEVWESQALHQASLALPAVQQAIGDGPAAHRRIRRAFRDDPHWRAWPDGSAPAPRQPPKEM